MTGNTYGKGVAWNGLTTVSENPSGAEPTSVWADNGKYLNLISAEEFGATIEALMYPKEFRECMGQNTIAPGVVAGQQTRRPFGFVFKTIVGNDTELDNYGYKIHIIHQAVAAPSEASYATVNDSPEQTTLSWELSTTPVPVPGQKPTAQLIIDSTDPEIDPDKLAALEAILFGSDETGEEGDARLPMPAEIISLMAAA
jgi:hypothetical protein